jgi:eukaryotic-like serine/threonine-protein kinase
MPIVSTGVLIDTLHQHGLLSAERIAHLRHVAQGRHSDARPLARLLVQRDWLTIYQINQILAGNAAELVFGPYHVLDRLGKGGLSAVYKARHTQFDMLVALKVIRPEVLTSAQGRLQFLQEIEAMAALDHPNVVQFCDADQVGNTCFFAMEYIEGTDLGKAVRLGGPLNVRDACDYIRQAALGLQHAHEHNLVHRDLKPVNLFLTHLPVAKADTSRPGAPARTLLGQPLIKILDWGLAGLRDPGRAEPGQVLENLAASVMGTADFLSPEQARDASAVDIRGDIYSLGCSFYFLLTGQPPFPEGTLMQKILQHQQAEPAPLDMFRDDIPVGVTAILKRMIAKQPENRFQTPAAVALALLAYARGDDGRGAHPALPLFKGVAPPHRRDDTPLPIALGGKREQAFARLSKVGAERGGTSADTACPQNR